MISMSVKKYYSPKAIENHWKHVVIKIPLIDRSELTLNFYLYKKTY